MARQKPMVRLVRGMTLPIIIKCKSHPVWKWYAIDWPTVAMARFSAVLIILVFIYVVSQMNDKIHRVFVDWVLVGIEATKGEICTGIDGQVYLTDLITGERSRQGPTNWALVV